MAKPVINSISAFDSNMGTTVSFSIGSSKSYGNKIWIYDTVTLSLIYEYPKQFKKSDTPVPLSCIIPANILQNGGKYYAQVQCIDANGVPGSMSEKSTFYCLSTPDFRFRDVVDGMKIDAGHLDVVVDYYQSNGEKLQSYRFGLYDKNKLLVSESELFYVASKDELKYRYKGLKTGQKYYINASGVTTKGLVASTGMLEINPEYVLKKDYAQIIPKNKEWGAYIEISTNIRLIGYNLDNRDYAFIANQYLDLFNRYPDKKDVLVYDNGFTIEGPFTMWLKLYSARPNEPVITMSNNTGQKIVITFHRIDNLCYYKLSVQDGEFQYIRYTERVPYSKTKLYTVFVRKHEDGLYDFKIFDGTESGVVESYTFQQQDGNLYINANGRMPVYQLVDPHLITGEDNVWYDHNTGNVYEVINS